MREEFERTAPEAVGISSQAVEELLDHLEAVTEMHGIMIMRHDRVCAEGWWAPYGPGIRHSLHSLSKTYSATAVGIAVTEGKLSLDDRIVDIFPEHLPDQATEQLRALRVRDVLCMGTGMEQIPEVTENWVRDYLAMPIVHEPGTAFQYNSVGSTLLCKIVEASTGVPAEAYLKTRLFKKIGIDGENFLWERMPDGTVFGGGGFYATTEDNLRLMKLYKDGGVWNGERILSEEYVQQAISKQIDSATERKGNPEASDNFLGYGFQIWMCGPEGVYRADGAMGQFSIVCPGQDMIISINETASNAHWAQNTLNEVWKFLETVSGQALPKAPERAAHLAGRLRSLNLAAPERVLLRNREKERELEGRIYLITKGQAGLETVVHQSHAGMKPLDGISEFSLSFKPGSCVMKFSQQGRAHQVEIATDGTRRWNRLVLEGRVTSEVYLSGRWTDDSHFLVTARWVESCYENELEFYFERDHVFLRRRNKVGRYKAEAELIAEGWLESELKRMEKNGRY